MTEANPQLMDLYGTDKIAARANAEGIPTAVRIAAALMGFGLLMRSQHLTDEAQEEARQLDEIARMMEEARMRPVLESLSKRGSASSLAMNIGQYMAKVSAINTGLEKLASGGDLTRNELEQVTHHFLVKLSSGGTESLNELEKVAITQLMSALGGFGRAAARGVGGFMKKAPGAVGRAGAKVEQAGIPSLPTSALRAAPPPLPAAARPVPNMRGVAGPSNVPPTITLQGAMPGAGRVPAPPRPPAGVVQAPTAATGTALARQQPAGAITKAQPAAAAASPGAVQRADEVSKGIVEATEQAGGGGGGLGWQGKALLGGGTLLAGYGALKGMQTAKDYMMVPSQTTQQWGWGVRPPAGVSPYGY